MKARLTIRVTSALAAGGLVLGAICAGVVPASAGAAPVPADRDHGPASMSRVQIVFDRWDPETGSAQLRSGDPLGQSSRTLTTPPSGSSDMHPVRSPDGRRIVFMRESELGVAIGVISLSRSSTVKWVDTGCSAVTDCAADINPTWNADGTRILFTRVMGPFDDESGDAASAALYSTTLEGADLRLVGAPPTPYAEDTGARYTPDGRHIVFIRDLRIDGELKFAIWRMRADGTEEQQLTPWELNADRPSPSPARGGPTAGLMTFETYGGARPGRGDIAMLPYMCPSLDECTQSIRYVTDNGGGPKSSYAASWSPEGTFLVYAEEPDADGGIDLWTSRWDGSLRHQLTQHGRSFSPAWS